jgi:phage terminase large subunit-like protein
MAGRCWTRSSRIGNMVVSGRGKKNYKTGDLVLGGLYSSAIRQNGDVLILANTENQAADDLSLCRKLIEANPSLRNEFELVQKELRRRDGRGVIKILPSDVPGLHGKVFGFCGFDEIHEYRDWDLMEALQMDPTKVDALTWITSYDTIYNTPGTPLYDLKQIGRAGEDPRLLFSWYSADLGTDPNFTSLEDPELRANPSIDSWPTGIKYLQQQKRRLPSSKYRRLHLNLPGAPSGAFLDQGKLLAAIVAGRKSLPYRSGVVYVAFVDMSGGSKDDAVLCICHCEGRTVVIGLLEKQGGGVPFDPRIAVQRFCNLLKEYHLYAVTGDNFAGDTFKHDFRSAGVTYYVCKAHTTELYEAFEPLLNSGEVELLDNGKMQEQALTLVMKGAKITHESNGHDDYINAIAGAVWLARHGSQQHPTGEQMRTFLDVQMPKLRAAARRDAWGGMGERRFLQRQRRWNSGGY